jgi:ATP-dependent RNA helicase SUPV3L1/SUV3
MQLWAVKQGTPDIKGLDELPHLAASGRTSFAADKDVPKSLYRTIGYRVCGERAVRVDILERLADLIRPALAWRPASPGPKPPGAFEGTGFTITGAMTSLAGSSGEDFASILRSLGYRMEKRPKPAEAPAEVPQAETAGEAAEATLPDATDASALGVAPVVPEDVAEAATSESTAEPQVESAAPTEEHAVVELAASASDEVTAPDTQAPALAPEQAEGVASVENLIDAAALGEAPVAPDALQEAAAADVSATDAEATAAEPELIEVWRPGRFEERRNQRTRTARPKHRGPHGRRDRSHAPGAPSDAPAPVAAQEGETVPAVAAAAEAMPAAPEQRRFGRPRYERDRDRQSDGPKRDGKPRQDRGQRSRDDRQRDDRAGGGRSFGKPRRDRDQADAAPKIYSSRERREKVADPNSPFAKLAALKEQLEAGAKDRH